MTKEFVFAVSDFAMAVEIAVEQLAAVTLAGQPKLKETLDRVKRTNLALQLRLGKSVNEASETPKQS